MFECAQCFFVDPSAVQSASEVGATSVDLFFKSKPDPVKNKSGISYPGVTIEIVPTINGVPAVPVGTVPTAYLGWAAIAASADASIPTTFRFAAPIQLRSSHEYALVVSFDGDEDFVLWKNVTGDPLIGSTLASSGPVGTGVGPYYTYATAQPPLAQASANATSSSSGFVTSGTPSSTGGANNSYLLTSWRASSSTELKFRVRVARYSFSGDANLAVYVSNSTPTDAQLFNRSAFVTGNSSGHTIPMPAARYEYVTFDRYSSSTRGVLSGERAFQNTFFYPGGSATPYTVACVNGSAVVTCSSINWANVLSFAAPEYVVITSLDHRGPGADSIAVRRVTGLVSNTVVTLDEPIPFTNASAYFFRSPVAKIDLTRRARLFGNTADLLVLVDSTANATMRFANDTVTNVAIVANGTGYSNSDYVTVSGFENVVGKVLGGYVATANVVTNANGSLTAVYLSNCGAGFVNVSSAVVAITNSTGGTSNGSSAQLSVTTGSAIKTEFYGSNGAGGYYANCKVVNIEVGDVATSLVLSNPGGSFYTTTHRMPYYSVDDAATSVGKSYYCDVDGGWDEYPVTATTVTHSWDLSKRRVLPSWSNEYNIPYSNGAACRALGGSTNGYAQPMTSNASVLLVRVASNNDFTAVRVAPRVTNMTVSRYVVNDDYTGEETDYGSAWAKGVETRLNFANNASAEDLRAYVTAWLPANTDVRVYARLSSATDPEAFVDKDWTLLELDPLAGPVTYSSSTDVSDLREITYRLPSRPIADRTLVGYATTQLGNAVVTGTGTSWSTNSTSNVVAGDLVVVYSTLFPNNYFVAPVDSVSNDTYMTLSDEIANNGLVGTGFSVDVVAKPHQAFNYVLSENVARYYNTGMTAIEGFDTMQVKIVMLSSDGMIYPEIDSVRAVGVSA